MKNEINTYLELTSGEFFKSTDIKIVHIDRRHVVSAVSETNDAGKSETYNDIVSIETIQIMNVKVHSAPKTWTTPFIEGEDDYYEVEKQ